MLTKNEDVTTPTTRRMLSSLETIVLHEFMKDKIAKLNDGLCEYRDGWTDAKIAAAAPISGCTESNAAGIRKQVWGNLKPADPPANIGTRLDKLETLAFNTASALSVTTASLVDRIEKLEVELGKIKLALKNKAV